MKGNSSVSMNLENHASTPSLTGRAHCARCSGRIEERAAVDGARALGGTGASARAGATPAEAAQAADRSRLTGPGRRGRSRPRLTCRNTPRATCQTAGAN
jgi:hypothetical protein